MSGLLLHFLLPLLLLSPSLQQHRYDDIDRLHDFKNGIWIDPSGLVFNTWIVATGEDPSLTSPCPADWHGVTCDSTNTNVVSLALDGLSLSGQIDLKTIAGMSSLQNLSLSGNNFTGTIPPTLGSTVSLQRLDLSKNRFYGAIPEEVSGLRNLNYVNLSFNNFSGEIPDRFQELRQLRVLDLRSNALSGDAGVVLSVLKNTVYMDLSDNLFAGELSMLPQEVHAVAGTLRHLNLSSNRLGGRFFHPETIKLFRNLVILDVNHNQLSGELLSFAPCYNLRVLWARDNLFVGPLPYDLLGVPTTIVNLDLSGNGFTGSISDIESTSLLVVNLSSNALSGSLPARTGRSIILDLSGNKLSGNLLMLQSWGHELEFVDLSSNNLSGRFPKQIHQLEALTYLKVSNNSLDGPLPSTLGDQRKLSMVDLSMNKITGPLCSCLFTSVSLKTLDLRRNHITGTIPFLEAPNVDVQMEYLDLSLNSLSGTLLPGVASLQKLKLLDLQGNSLSGRMPSELGELQRLEILDLSSNNFDGAIPNISQASLRVLNLTHNNLSGPIPQSMKRFPDYSFHPGNPLLGTTQAVKPPLQGVIIGGGGGGGKGGEEGGGGGGGGDGGGFGGVVTHNSSSNSSGVASKTGQDSRHKSTTGMVAAIIVGGVGLVALVMIMIAMAANMLKTKTHRLKEQTTSRELKLGKFFCSPKKSFKAGTTGAGFSYGPLVNSPSESRCASLKRDMVDGAVECELSFPSSDEQPLQNMVDLGVPGAGHDYSDGRSFSPLGITVVDSGVAPDQTGDLVDRPLGVLHFFNDSALFTVEELARAPAEILGGSGHGTMCKATLNSGHALAVKYLRPRLLKKKKEFAKEIRRLGGIKHPNIVPIKCYYWGPKDQEKFIVSDHVNGRSLAFYLLHESSGRTRPLLTLKQRLRVAVDVARGLCFLHQEKGLPHGNLKATNILVCGASPTAQLTDYGVHNLVTSGGSSELMLNFGALGYRTPGASATAKPTYEADIYAYGVVLMELLTGRSAGDIICGQRGMVDLTDWVQKCAREGKGKECFDEGIATEAPHVMKELLAISLKCVLPVDRMRPNIKIVFQDLLSIGI